MHGVGQRHADVQGLQVGRSAQLEECSIRPHILTICIVLGRFLYRNVDFESGKSWVMFK